MIKKELIAHVSTLEEGEFTKINAIDGEPGYFLLSLGQQRIVVNGAELMEAMSSIDYYAAMFKQEATMKANRSASPPKAVVLATPTTSKRGKKNTEEEGTLVLDPVMRLGPTDSELALERQTQHMKGETLVLTEKK